MTGPLVDQLGLLAAPLLWAASLDLRAVGFAIVGLVVLMWLVALTAWRLGRFEERWATRSSETT